MKTLRQLLSVVAIAFFAMSTTVQAQIPRTLSYQGVIVNNLGAPIADGSHSITITIYDNASTLLFTETQSAVVVKGQFNFIIGATIPLPGSLTFDRPYNLGIAVDGGAEMTPRTPLTSAPYAMHAVLADQATALAPGATGIVTSVNGAQGPLTIQGTGTTTVSNVGGLITINSTGGGGGGGLTLPYAQTSANDATLFDISTTGTGRAGSFKILNDTSSEAALYAQSSGVGGAAVFFKQTAGPVATLTTQAGTAMNAAALFARTDGTGSAAVIRNYNALNTTDALVVSTAGAGNAISGTSSIATGSTAGVYGEANSTSNGIGAKGGVTGVLGVVTPTSPGGYSAALRGVNNGTGGTGIGAIGYQGGSGWGVYGETPKGFGVYGLTTDATAASSGVRGETFSTNGIGVEAKYSGSGVGVALEVDNGTIRVAGVNKSAFVHTATVANKMDLNGTDITNPLCDGDPNALLFVTQHLSPTTAIYNPNPIGVYYNTTRNKWEIINEVSTQAIPTNAQFNVLVIKQ